MAWSGGGTMLCCGFELLGSKQDVALPCPSADTLKVLGGTHPAHSGLGWKLELELELWHVGSPQG